MFMPMYSLAQGGLRVVDVPIHHLQMHEIRIRINRYINIWDTKNDGYGIPAEILTKKVIGIEASRFYDEPTLEIKVE